jgi:hypothetical protein
MRSDVLAALLLAGAASCQPSTVVSSTAAAGANGAGLAGAPGGSAPAGGGGDTFVLPDAAADVHAPVSTETCAEEVHRAEIVPLDLMLLVDSSASMSDSAGAGSKWQAAQNALTAFVKDPRSVGLGVGLQFYPGGRERTCTTDADCGAMGAGTFYCRPRQACVGAGGLIGALSCGGADSRPCVAGTTCTTVGRCSTSGDDCQPIGQACPAGGGMCEGGQRSCRTIFPFSSCDEPGYAVPAVPVASLPSNEVHIARTVLNKVPAGATPMGPAVRGVQTQLRAHQAANPGHKVALVLVGDGLPGGCAGNDIPTISTNLSGALATAPSIPTYVIGVFAPSDVATSQPVLDRLAMAGGTTRAFLLTSTADLTQRLQQALDEIRGAAIACEFAIPQGKAGAIDFNRVNVRHTGAGGTEELLYVESADRCDPMRGGWYYDVSPSKGTPTRVLVCGASCQRFKMDAAAKVDLVFGCATRVIMSFGRPVTCPSARRTPRQARHRSAAPAGARRCRS